MIEEHGLSDATKRRSGPTSTAGRAGLEHWPIRQRSARHNWRRLRPRRFGVTREQAQAGHGRTTTKMTRALPDQQALKTAPEG